ncbi:SGNH/GDSL hydrolase family protein [uncultured Lacinutrix sp.]|uniref:SGNH/GDSL hydrolase family protein n=1 Tax=uncultured Lacinutrix sp. TaxID=574032 RepID=UPI00261178E3|nr:SGNH/GDSL hydrolase family protein [uncultured Lacinutrix sp.]
MKYLSLSFLKKLALSGLVLVILIVFAEIILSALKIFPDDYFTMTPNSGFTWIINPDEIEGIQGDSEIAFDALGARSISNIENKEHKIAVFGGSTTACFALSQERTWTALLEKKLGDKYWVGNFGRPGNSSNHHILQIDRILDKPELNNVETVLVMLGVNDFVGYLVSSEQYLHSSDTELQKFAFQHTPPSKESSFRQKSTVYRLMAKAKKKIKFYFSHQEYLTKTSDDIKAIKRKSETVDSLPSLTLGLEHYQKNIERIIQLAKEKNIDLVFTTQATMWKPNLEEKYEKLLLTSGFKDNKKFYSTEAFYNGMRAFNERLIATCKENNISYIDIEDLPKTTVSFYDDFHFNESGAKLVSEKIYKGLKK